MFILDNEYFVEHLAYIFVRCYLFLKCPAAKRTILQSFTDYLQLNAFSTNLRILKEQDYYPFI